MINLNFFICLFLTLCLVSFDVSAQEKTKETHAQLKPLYEFGIGALMADFPDYPGADHNRRIYLPFPSVIFRGDILRAEKDEGVRGRFLKSKIVELDLSFDGTFPSDASDNIVREGMPGLDAVLEIGPSLIFHLKKLQTRHGLKVDFHFASRYNFSSDLKRFDHRGFSINPFFNFVYEGFVKDEGLILFSIGAKFATKKLMDYYYGVDYQYSRANRPFYHAKSGFLETSLAFAFFQPVKYDIWLFAGIIKAFYDGASNERSPLLVKKSTTSIAFGFYWNFHKAPFYILDT